jgi:hypothetical protein
MLIPEQKQADHFLMIKGIIHNDRKIGLLKLIKATTNVLTAFELDPNKLKSKDNLLF